jgi:AcrR family transcriptional regulator
MTGGDKRAKALASAYDVFLRYGFRRTTMDDIAKEAGMSRPALYLLFKNKPEIFRALAQDVCVRCLSGAEAVLKTRLKKSDKLLAILDLGMLDVMEELARSPHGEELIGVEHEIAADIDTHWHKNLSGFLSHVIGGDEAHVRSVFILDAIQGMKQRGVTVADMRVTLKSMLSLV